ncbi:6-phosphogluconolactonase [Chloropicon primus]|nr:6-phosphogluconolactonase [Chloropicon primus]
MKGARLVRRSSRTRTTAHATTTTATRRGIERGSGPAQANKGSLGLRRSVGAANPHQARLLRLCAVAEPTGEKENKEQAVANVAASEEAGKPARKKKPAKAKKEKKEPWPLTRYSNPVSTTGKTHYNVIHRSQWPTGVPSVMGGHMMPSGEVAPVATSPSAIKDIYDATQTQYVHPFHYYEEERVDGTRENSSVNVHNNKASLSASVCDEFASKAKESIAATGKFTVALSGGSLIQMLEGLKERKQEVDWSKVYVFWVDERLCDLSDKDSNAGAAKAAFLDDLGIPEGNHHTIDGSLPVDQAARAYEGKMLQLSQEVLPRTEDNLPVLDLVVLGMGPDAHVASLFPNRQELAENPKQWVLPVSNSPKPPSERITMTMDVINSARQVMLVAAGKGKAEVVQRVLEHQSLPGALPAQLVMPKQGKLVWLLDAESASEISPTTWDDNKAWPRNNVPKPST